MKSSMVGIRIRDCNSTNSTFIDLTEYTEHVTTIAVKATMEQVLEKLQEKEKRG